MRHTYDTQADAVYIYIEDNIPDAGVARTIPVPGKSINLDFGGDGRLLGVEILDAR